MATTTTPNMGLVLPTPGSEPGPAWASELNTAQRTIDAHDHTPGKGVPVPNTAVQVLADWDFGQFGIRNINWMVFTGETTVDLTRIQQLYSDPSGELNWIDANGTIVQITSGGALALTNNGGINGDYATDPAVPSVTYNTSARRYTFSFEGPALATIRTGGLLLGLKLLAVSTSYTVTDTDNVSVVAIDTSSGTGSTVTLPLAVNNPGRVLTIKDRTGTANLHNFTVARSGGDTIDGSTSIVFNGSYAVFQVVSDGVSRWMVV